MKGYGQFCAVARALDRLGERWTLLVVRELLCGSRRFGDIERGIPRISRTMLSTRLRQLCDASVVEKVAGEAGPEYVLTERGRALEPLVRELGAWGQKWLPRHLSDSMLDADALLWDMRRRVRLDALPVEPVVVELDVVDGRGRSERRFLLLRRAEASLCTENPGFPAEVVLRAEARNLVAWWRGDISFEQARRAGLSLTGPRALVRALPGWFERYLFADIAPAA
jgi:DNA-binding HxlR family transcriptional regulator